MVAQLVATTTHVSVLVTSRVPLGIDDERVFRLGMLAYPNRERPP